MPLREGGLRAALAPLLKLREYLLSHLNQE